MVQPGTAPGPAYVAAESGEDQQWQWGAPPTQPGTGALDSRRRTGWRTAIIIVAAALVVGLLAFGGTVLFGGSSQSSSAAQASTPVSPPAKSKLDQALNKAEAAGTFHYVTTTKTSGATATTVGDAGPQSGIQQINTSGSNAGPATFTVMVVGSTTYFKGDPNAMVQNLNVSSAAASAHAEQWISLQPSDGTVYWSTYAAVRASDALHENITIKPQALSTTTLGGRSYDVVSGALLPVNIPGEGVQKVNGTGKLWISSKSHLPVRYSQTGTTNGQKGTTTMTFGQFGEPLTVTAPSGSITYSSIASSGTPSTGPPGSFIT